MACSLEARATKTSRTTKASVSAVAVGMTKTDLLALVVSAVTPVLAGLLAAAALVTRPAVGEVALAAGVMTGSMLVMLPGLVIALTMVCGLTGLTRGGMVPMPGAVT